MDYTQMLVSRKTLSFMELFAVPGSPALKIACACVSFAMWLEKGLGLVVAGFIPNPFEQVRQYFPTIPEVMIALGVWATGFFVLTLLYRIATSVKEEVA